MSTRRLSAMTVVVASAAVLLAGCSTAAATPAPTKSTTDIVNLKVGDCANDAGASGTVTGTKTVPCTGPHYSEAFASLTVPGSKFPGADAIQTQANEGCASAFATFIGIPFDDSSLDVTFYYPTAESWKNGDRSIVCEVYDNGVQTTGTLKNAQR